MRILRRERRTGYETRSAARGIKRLDQDNGKWWGWRIGRDSVRNPFSVLRVRKAYKTIKDKAGIVSPFISQGRRYSFLAQKGCGSDPTATVIRIILISGIIESPGVWTHRAIRLGLMVNLNSVQHSKRKKR